MKISLIDKEKKTVDVNKQICFKKTCKITVTEKKWTKVK